MHDGAEALLARVETRLKLAASATNVAFPTGAAPTGFIWSDYGWLACAPDAFEIAYDGTHKSDHVVFLRPALPTIDHDGERPVFLKKVQGVLIGSDATPSQKDMLRCWSDVLLRLQKVWCLDSIGHGADVELLDWDAEKYRQTLAGRS